jgi:hypothetical protein
MIKTLFLFTESPNEGNDSSIFFFEKEGDYRHLNGTFINMTNNEANSLELGDLVYGNGLTGGPKDHVTMLKEPTKDWDYFVSVGFFL